MEIGTKRPAMRAYSRRVLIASIAYALLLFGATYALKHWAVALPVRILIALLPGLAIVAIFVALGRYLVEETDEYLRARMVRQMLWATGGTLSAATVYGFLDVFEAAPRLPLYSVAILWFFCLGVAGAVLRLRGA